MKPNPLYFLILISLLFLSTSFNKSSAQNNIHLPDLYQYVPDKSLNQTNKDKQARQKIRCRYLFDNITSINAAWNENDSLGASKDTLIYNGKGQILTIKRTKRNNETKWQNELQEVKYTWNLNKVAKINYFYGNGKTAISYTYNTNGKLSEVLKTTYSKGAAPNSYTKNEANKYVYKFPTENKIEIIEYPQGYTKNGYAFYEYCKTQYLFNQQGNIENIYVNYPKEGIDTIVYRYDENGNLLQIKTKLFYSKTPTYTNYSYDNNENLTKIKAFYDSTLFKYNSDGLLSNIKTNKDNFNYNYYGPDKLLGKIIKNRFDEHQLVFMPYLILSKEIEYFHTKDFFVFYNFKEPCIVEFYNKQDMIFSAKVDNPLKSLFINHFQFQKIQMVKIRYKDRTKYMIFSPSGIMNGLFGPEPIIFEKKIL